MSAAHIDFLGRESLLSAIMILTERGATFSAAMAHDGTWRVTLPEQPCVSEHRDAVCAWWNRRWQWGDVEGSSRDVVQAVMGAARDHIDSCDAGGLATMISLDGEKLTHRRGRFEVHVHLVEATEEGAFEDVDVLDAAGEAMTKKLEGAS